MLADKITQDETGIKIRFNELCRQFENNKKYKSMTDKEQTIPDDEDLSYEMTVNNKRYEAVYYQQLEITDSIAFAKKYDRTSYRNIPKNNWPIPRTK